MSKIIDEFFFKKILLEKLKDFLNSEKITYPPKIKKSEIEILLKDLLKNETLMKNFCDRFKKEIALTPYDLEQKLNCSKTERLRWTSEGKIPVVYYEEFHKAGKCLQAPQFDRYFVCTQISEITLSKWREEHKIKVRQNLQKVISKSKESKLKNDLLRKNFIFEFHEEVVKFLKRDPELGIVFELAFWTQWLNRWAKTNQIKATRAIKHKEKYLSLRDHYYNLKNASLKLLLKSKYVNLFFYQPERPDKVFIRFCDYHYSLLKYGISIDPEVAREFPDIFPSYYFNPVEEYFTNQKVYDNCKNCEVEKQEDYYSLFFLELKSDLLEDYYFSFHTPYPLGKDFFPDKDSLQKVTHIENEEGMFRFGRPVSDSEEIIYSESTVLKNFLNSLHKAERVLSS